MKSSTWLGINHKMIQCAIYNFLLIESIKENKIFCSVSLFLTLYVGCQTLYLSCGQACFYEPINI